MTANNKDLETTDDTIDSLHIPHLGFLQWYSNGISIKASMHDKTSRVFGVRFFLEDLCAGTTWAHLKLDENMVLSIHDEQGEINIVFENNKEGHFNSILVGLNSEGCIEAFKKASTFIHSMLSTLCFFYRRPLKIRAIVVNDKKHLAELSTRKTSPKEVNLIKPLATFKLSPIGSLFAIYRDGMNSVDLAYRYICFFKIYEAWKVHWGKFFNGISKAKPKIVITKNLLAGSYRQKHHYHFLNKTINNGDVYEALKNIRHYLVHPVINEGAPSSYYNLDQIETLESLESFSNLMERVVTKILDVELKRFSEIDEETKKLLAIYNAIKR